MSHLGLTSKTKRSSFPRRRESSQLTNSPTQWDNTSNMALSAMRRLFDKLDSRLRGNDGLFGAWFKKYFSVLFVVLLGLLSTQAGARSHTHNDSEIQIVAVAELPPEARDTLRLIKQGGPFPFPRDGVVFGNYEKRLPQQPRGCTSDTLLTKSAACGRRCEAGAPAPKGSTSPCRARYHEYTVKTPGTRNRGARRIVCGEPAECYYSNDHYKTFRRIRE